MKRLDETGQEPIKPGQDIGLGDTWAREDEMLTSTKKEFVDIRVGMVGAGYVSNFHLEAWAKVPDASVVAICDPNVTNLTQRVDQFDIHSSFPDLNTLLAQAEINVLDIVSPREFHYDHVVRAVEAASENTLAVQCQKPLALTLAEAEKLAQCVPTDLPFMVHENWRFRPEYRTVKKWLEERRIGPLVSCRMDIRTSALYPDAAGNRPAIGRQPFLGRVSRLAVAEVFIHHIDTLRWLIGPLALVDSQTWRTQEEIAGETAAILRFRSDDGIPVTLDGHMAVPGAPNGARDRVGNHWHPRLPIV